MAHCQKNHIWCGIWALAGGIFTETDKETNTTRTITAPDNQLALKEALIEGLHYRSIK